MLASGSHLSRTACLSLRQRLAILGIASGFLVGLLLSVAVAQAKVAGKAPVVGKGRSFANAQNSRVETKKIKRSKADIAEPDRSQGTSRADSGTSEAREKAPPPERSSGVLQVRNDAFVSPDYRATSNTNLVFLGGGFSTLEGFRFPEARRELVPRSFWEERTSRVDGIQTETTAYFSPQASVMSYVNIAQLFHQGPSFAVGRKRLTYSIGDEIFCSGVYEPRLLWNPLRPESQGLSGIFLELKNREDEPSWGLTVMASSVYLPDQGPGFELRDGQFQSVNPWFRTPPREIQVGPVVDRLDFRIAKVNESEVLLQRSWVGKAYAGSPTRGFFLQLAGAYKPVNQLTLGLDANSVPQEERVLVDVSPRTSYHRVASADMKWSGRWYGVGLSLLQEMPEDPKLPEPWTYGKYSNSQVSTPFVEYRWRSWQARAALQVVTGGEVQATGPQAQRLKDQFQNRYPAKSSQLFELRYRFYSRRDQGFTLSTSYQAADQAAYELVEARAQYQWSRFWSVNFGAIMVRSDLPSGNVFADNQNNDQFNLGIQYVF